MEEITIRAFYEFIEQRKIAHFFNIACRRVACQAHVRNLDGFEHVFGHRVEAAADPNFYKRGPCCRKELSEFFISIIVPVRGMKIEAFM